MVVEVVCPSCGAKRLTSTPDHWVCSNKDCRKTIRNGVVGVRIGRPPKGCGPQEPEDPQLDELDKRFRMLYKLLGSLKKQVLRSEGVVDVRDQRYIAKADIYFIKALFHPGNERFKDKYLNITASIAQCEAEEDEIAKGYVDHDPKFDTIASERALKSRASANNMLPDPPINTGTMCGAKQGAVTSGERLEPLMMVACKCGHNSRVKQMTAKEMAEVRCESCKKKGTYRVVIAYADKKPETTSTNDTDTGRATPALQGQGKPEAIEEARIPLQQVPEGVVVRKEHGAKDTKDEEVRTDGVAPGPGHGQRKRFKQERKGRRTGRRRGSPKGSVGQGNRGSSEACCQGEDDASYRCPGGKRDNSLIE